MCKNFSAPLPLLAQPDEKGPLAAPTFPPLPPLEPIESPRLLLLRNLPRPLEARRSSASRSLSFLSSSLAILSRSAASLRIIFGRNLATGGALVARPAKEPRPTVLPRPPKVPRPARLPRPIVLLEGCRVSELPEGVEPVASELPSTGCDCEPAAAAPLPLPELVPLPPGAILLVFVGLQSSH